jgi:hypothetical protein
MRMRMAVLAVWLVTAGCAGRGPLLSGVAVAPGEITPNGDGNADVARLTYTIGQPARVTIVLRGADGHEYTFRDHRPRQPGQFEALFGGVIDGRMLPDGGYDVVVRAEPPVGTGPAVEATARLTLRDGDQRPPALSGFTLDRSTFTPNQDGIGDAVHISFTVDEALAGFRMWLETADGRYVTDIVQERRTADDPTRPGAHDFRFDAGVDADAPPPADGEYRVVAEARDRTGNITRQSLPLTIRDSGKPSVTLKGDVTWSQKVLPIGATLYFTATVQNAGDTPLRTRGPEPGFVYDNDTSYNQVAPAEVVLLARAGGRATSARVPVPGAAVTGVTLDLVQGPVLYGGTTSWGPATATPAPSAVPLPGPPEGPRTVRVCGRVVDGTAPVAGAEVFAFEADGDNGVRSTAGPDGAFCFEALTMPPPLERNYTQSSGAMRLAVKYDDARQTLDYPYRWQLGRTADLDVCTTEDRLYLCLPPGKQVQVTGGIRFVEPPYRRLTQIYTAVVHEDVRVIQPGYGQQQLTVEHD